jgi:hypothetical protein
MITITDTMTIAAITIAIITIAIITIAIITIAIITIAIITITIITIAIITISPGPMRTHTPTIHGKQAADSTGQSESEISSPQDLIVYHSYRI